LRLGRGLWRMSLSRVDTPLGVRIVTVHVPTRATLPANTTIQAHSHRDDRMATVVSGTWYFGYGDRFDAKSLKKLPGGSVYSEPGAHNHFAPHG
jgi:uncharacterized RmlC-like cupin family protein